MPSQIVQLLPSTIDAIVGNARIRRDIAFGKRDMQAKVRKRHCGTDVVRIEIDRLIYCPEITNQLHDDVYALLLTSSAAAPDLVQPTRLPDPLVRHVLDEVQAALLQLHNLTAHDQLDIAGGISQACQSAAVVLPSVECTPADLEESDRLRRAADLQQQLRPALDRIDRRLDQYARDVRKHGVELAMVRLGLQADLGAALRLKSANDALLPHLAIRHRRGDFIQLWQSTRNTLAVFQSCLEQVHQGTCTGRSWLGNGVLLPLHGTLLSRLVKPFSCGCYRSPGMRIRPPFGEGLRSLATPADEVAGRVRAFAHGYDTRLWRGIHPLVRSGMSHIELMGTHPFPDGNGRLGRLLLQSMLIEDGVPGLPMDVVWTWNRDSYLERVDAAVCKADLLGFMQFLLKATDKAIDLGRHFLPDLVQGRDELFSAFAEYGGRFATLGAELGVSTLLGPDEQFVSRVLADPREISRRLDEAGFNPVATGAFAVCGLNIENGWSSPVARRLLIAPPAKL
jgi:hypothetical protein